ncbi:MAG: hypothetical protein AB1638_10830, partial [Nitrospirota bacterium]
VASSFGVSTIRSAIFIHKDFTKRLFKCQVIYAPLHLATWRERQIDRLLSIFVQYIQYFLPSPLWLLSGELDCFYRYLYFIFFSKSILFYEFYDLKAIEE